MGPLNNELMLQRRGYTDIETAKLLGMSPNMLRRWRLTGQGPRYRKLSGGAVRYFAEDIEAFILTSPSGGGHQTEAN